MTQSADLAPVRREILVDSDPATAFEVFTQRIGSWWPLAGHSVYGSGADVAFRDGRIVETAKDQPDALWGTVIDWDPPHRLSFSWHPGHDADHAGLVEVAFTAAGEQTLVQLTHSGWAHYADPAAAQAEYGEGWPVVLEQFQVTVADQQTESTWVALIHQPTAITPPVPEMFADPRFSEHFAFVNHLK